MKEKIYLDANIVYGYFLAKYKELKKKEIFIEPKVIKNLRNNKEKFNYFVSIITKVEIIRRLRTELNFEKEEALDLWESLLKYLQFTELEMEEKAIDWYFINRIVLEVKIKKRLSNLIHFSFSKSNELTFLTGDKEILEKCKQFYSNIISYSEFRKLAESLNIEKVNDNYERQRLQESDNNLSWEKGEGKSSNSNDRQRRVREESNRNNEESYSQRKDWLVSIPLLTYSIQNLFNRAVIS